MDPEQQPAENEEDVELEIEEHAENEEDKILKWECALKAVKILKEDMNRLVMNFLVTQGNLEAVEKFQKESGTKPEGDLANITERSAIINAIRCRNLEDASQKLNALNPELLKTNFRFQQQKLIELIRDENIEGAMKFSEDELTPFAEENEAFREELEKTIGLLLFENLYTCPSKDLVGDVQWSKTASEVNAAIYTSHTGEKGAKLERLLKMLTWTQNQLDGNAVYPRMIDFSTCQLEMILPKGTTI